MHRVVRAGEVVWEGPCTGMRRHKLEVNAVGRGNECGVVLDEGRFAGMQPGDIIQCVKQQARK